MDTINRLREALLRVLSTPDLHNDGPDLFDQLMIQKPQLQKLLDVGPSNAQERLEVESG
jgi:nuclear pore complex protein Nup205